MIPFRAAAMVVCLATPATAVTCLGLDFEGQPYTVCEVDPASEDLRLFHADASGRPFGTFSAVADTVAPKRLAFAMNAGMFHPDLAPVGLFLDQGGQRMRLITGAGPGNFGLLPNGVFCIGEGWARVMETLSYRDASPECLYATQSGPMLVIDGDLHPGFLPDSTSRFIRNGVGTSAMGDRVVFAISDRPVTFYDFARLFRDALDLPQALFFDGNVSRLWAPSFGRQDVGRPVGPMVGVVE